MNQKKKKEGYTEVFKLTLDKGQKKKTNFSKVSLHKRLITWAIKLAGQ